MDIFINMGISLLLMNIIIQRLKRIKKIIIQTRKKYVEVIIASIVFITITYLYANTWVHYMIGILAIVMFVTMWLAQGVTSEGFISMYKYKEKITWDEIENVIVIKSKDIKIKLSGRFFMQQTFYFKKSDYDKVIIILKEKLPVQSRLETIYYK